MQDHKTNILGTLAALGAGTWLLATKALMMIGTVVDGFGTTGTVCGGILAATAVMALAWKGMKKLDRIDKASNFVCEELMMPEDGIPKPNTFRAMMMEAKDEARQAKELSQATDTRSQSNEKKLDKVLGHTNANKEMAKEMLEMEKTLEAKVDKSLNKPA